MGEVEREEREREREREKEEMEKKERERKEIDKKNELNFPKRNWRIELKLRFGLLLSLSLSF